MKENPSCHGVHLLWEAWLNTDMLGSTGPTPASLRATLQLVL